MNKTKFSFITILCCLLLAFFSSCKFNFTDKDLTAYKAYKEGDTLVFQSSKNVSDTFVITKKEIVHYGENENTGWYNPPTAIIRYTDYPSHEHYAAPGTVKTKEDPSLLTIYKTRPLDKLDEELFFEGFVGQINRKNQFKDSINGISKATTIVKVPLFDNSIARDSTDIQTIYWNDSIGIVAYDYKNGNRWILKSKNKRK